MNEIARARVIRNRGMRIARLNAWANKLEIQMEIKWPPGIFGAIFGLTMMLCPPLLLFASVRFGLWLKGRVTK